MHATDDSDPAAKRHDVAALGIKQPRAPWQPPRLTRVPLTRTELGGTVGNEGNGVFAFTQLPP